MTSLTRSTLGRKPDLPVILLDLNVILDVLLRREPFFRDSAALLAACEAGRCRGVIAAHSVTILAYILSKRRGEAATRASLASLRRIVGVAVVDDRVIDYALTSHLRDFEDAVQMGAAVAAGAKHIATRDLKDFEGGPVPAAAPAELIPALLAL